MPLNEADTCRTYVLPKLYSAGWEDTQISEQKSFTDGRIVLVGNRAIRRPAEARRLSASLSPGFSHRGRRGQSSLQDRRRRPAAGERIRADSRT